VTGLRVLAFVVGVAVVTATTASVFTTLVVPRAGAGRLMRAMAALIGLVTRPVVRRLPTFTQKDRVMAVVGPLAMVLLFVVWLALMVVGFALITWWPAGGTLGHAFAIAGSSVFTLGVATGHGAGAETIEFVAAGFGLLVIALEIAYLPTLYSAFAARETEVTLLASRSGNPAWGAEILARAHWFRTTGELTEAFGRWERWAAAVSESHANYPSLMWFRSPVSTRSWLLGLTAMLDAAALFDAASPSVTPRQARVFLMAGTECLRSLAETLGIPVDRDPLPTTPLRLSYAEFEAGLERLRQAAYPFERPDPEVWRNFSGWRINYEPLVDELTRRIMPPPAPWLLPRPELGPIMWPAVRNRTPDQPEGRPPSEGLGGLRFLSE
jgi:hypothetical protein